MKEIILNNSFKNPRKPTKFTNSDLILDLENSTHYLDIEAEVTLDLCLDKSKIALSSMILRDTSFSEFSMTH